MKTSGEREEEKEEGEGEYGMIMFEMGIVCERVYEEEDDDKYILELLTLLMLLWLGTIMISC